MIRAMAQGRNELWKKEKKLPEATSSPTYFSLLTLINSYVSPDTCLTSVRGGNMEKGE